MRRWPNVGIVLGQRRRRWANSIPTLGQRLMFAGMAASHIYSFEAGISDEIVSFRGEEKNRR